MANAKLIVLESLDGGGKTTQSDLIKKYLEKHNIKYEYIHFPSYDHNEYGKVISAFLRGEYGNVDEVNPIFVANIYAMDRYLYLPTLQKQMVENDVVVLDRYVFSNMAFQGAKYNTDVQSQIMRDWINEFEFGFLELPYPDLNIFFDVPIKIIKERLKEKREGKDRDYLKGKSYIHELDIEFQKKVRDNYLALKDYQGYKIILTESLNPESIFNKYKDTLDLLLFNKIIENEIL
jgi:dTMP kinase